MRLEKRYIYSAIMTGIFFMIIYAVLDFYLWISLLLSAVVYVGGIFLFKSKDIRVYDRQALAKYNFEMSKLNDYKEKIKDKTIKEKISLIVRHSQKICDYLGYEHIGTHSFRKRFATLAYENSGHDIELVRKLMQHSSASITSRYLGISDERMDSVLKGCVSII